MAVQTSVEVTKIFLALQARGERVICVAERCAGPVWRRDVAGTKSLDDGPVSRVTTLTEIKKSTPQPVMM